MPNPRLEQIHVDQFIRLYLAKDIRAIPQKPPEPDFVVQSDGKSIGIEHTQLIRLPDQNGINFMAHNAIGERIVAEAERLYNQKHRHCLRVAIDFKCGYGLAINDPVQLYNNDIEKLSRYIADFVSERLPSIRASDHGTHFSYEPFNWDTGKVVLPEKIDLITITNTASYKIPCWTTLQSVMVPDGYNSKELSTILIKKNKKPKNYLSSYYEKWLLIVEDSMDLNSYFDFEDHNEKAVDSVFNKVFILRRANNIFIELKIK